MKYLKLILRIIFLPVFLIGLILLMITAIGTLVIKFKNVFGEFTDTLEDYFYIEEFHHE